MKVIAIDASRGHYALNRTLLAVIESAEEAGAEVTYLRLSDFTIMDCLNCRLCAMGEGCKMEDDFADLLEYIAQSNGIIISAPDDKSRSSQALRTLLGRLSTFFEGNRNHQLPLPGFGATNEYMSKTARDTKRAVVITTAASNGGIGAYFMPSAVHGYQIKRLRRSLAACNINAVGSLEVGRSNLRKDKLCFDSQNRAESMGRLIAGKL